MLTRSALLFASTALLAAASPALAQDDRYGMADDQAIEWEQREVVQEWDYEGAADADAQANGEAFHRSHHGHGDHHGHSRMQHQTSAPRLAYSLEEREAWLADCRIMMRGEDYYREDARYEDDEDDGGLIGGILGAVIGGVAGNRIGGSGDRLAGTLIGAGVGGIAGAVIGNAIDDEDDREHYDPRAAEDAWAADYCEAYLRRYEASGQAGYGQMAYAHVQPVMMMTAPAHHGSAREIIREEWVEVPVEQAAPHRSAQRRAAPARGKLTSAN